MKRRSPLRVVVAGAGAAALEALVALRHLAGERVELVLLAPDTTFAYRAVSAVRPFAVGPLREVPLVELTAEAGATQVSDELALVDDERRVLLTRDGEQLAFDALLVAVGAREAEPVEAALTWHADGRAAAGFAALLEAFASGDQAGAAFIAPADAPWPVPAYELALIAAFVCARAGTTPNLLVATAEETPLGALGNEAAELVSERLEEAGVELVTRARVENPPAPRGEGGADALSALFRRAKERQVARHPRLHAAGHVRDLRDEHLVALAGARGHFVSGLPHDAHGFLPIDEHARVRGTDAVWAAGDATSLNLKHSLVAAAQAGAAARSIAAQAGALDDPAPWEPVLHGLLLEGQLEPRLWHWDDRERPPTGCLWWPTGRVTGPELAHLLAARDPAIHPRLLGHPRGLATTVRLHPADGRLPAWRHPELDPGEVTVDAARRSSMALRRAERQSRRREAAASQPLERFSESERKVIERLEAAGYLGHEGDAGDAA